MKECHSKMAIVGMDTPLDTHSRNFFGRTFLAGKSCLKAMRVFGCGRKYQGGDCSLAEMALRKNA